MSEIAHLDARRTERARVMLLIDPASLPPPLVGQLMLSGAASLVVPDGQTMAPPGAPARLGSGPLQLDPPQRRGWWEDRDLGLTQQEFSLLHALAVAPDHALSFEALHERVWGDRRRRGDTDRVRCAVKRLRRKLGEVGGGSLIKSQRGYGFRLAVWPASAGRSPP